MIGEMLRKDVRIEYVEPTDPTSHYTITPYVFTPKVGRKYVKHFYTDMGQGLLMCMQEVYEDLDGEATEGLAPGTDAADGREGRA
jgi:UDP-glucose 4-epimerase